MIGSNKSDAIGNSEGPTYANAIYAFFIFPPLYFLITWIFEWVLLSWNLSGGTNFGVGVGIFLFAGSFFLLSLPLGVLFGLYFGIRIWRRGGFSWREALSVSLLVGVLIPIPFQSIGQILHLLKNFSVSAAISYIWLGLNHAIIIAIAVLVIRYLLISWGLMSPNIRKINEPTR